MTKRIAAIILLLCMIIGMMPATASAQSSFIVGNGVEIPNSKVPTDGSNPYCNCGKTVGYGSHTCCWNYGYYVYYYIWGEVPERRNESMLYLRNVAAEDRLLTEENLYKYLKNAAPGAILRIDQSSKVTSGDEYGHTLIFVQMNAEGDGAWFLEGNYNGKGNSRLSEIKFSKLVSSFGPDSSKGYRYIKYIGWPNAPEYYETYLDVCQTYPAYCQVSATVDTVAMRYPCSSGVDSESVPVATVSAGSTYTALSLQRNDRDEYWYEIELPGQENAYVSAETMEHEANITADAFVADVRAPISIRQGNSYSIKGTVSGAQGRLTQVEVCVYSGRGTQGECVLRGSDEVSAQTYTLAYSTIDNAIRFGSLEKGEYTYAVWASVEQCFPESDGSLVWEETRICVYQNYFQVTGWSETVDELIFDPCGGSCDVYAAGVIRGDALGCLPEASRDGYRFEGWYNAAGVLVTEQTVSDGDSTLYAYWEKLCCHDNLTEVAQTAATCTEAGNHLYYVCNDCGAVLAQDRQTLTTAEEQTIDRLGHRGQTVTETETDDGGYDRIVYCAHCGEELGRTHISTRQAGDANGDGRVNNIDAMLVLQYFVGVIDSDCLDLAASDVDGNGKVNNLDAMIVLQMAVGLR